MINYFIDRAIISIFSLSKHFHFKLETNTSIPLIYKKFASYNWLTIIQRFANDATVRNTFSRFYSTNPLS